MRNISSYFEWFLLTFGYGCEKWRYFLKMITIFYSVFLNVIFFYFYHIKTVISYQNRVLPNTTEKGHKWHFLKQNSSKSNALQKGAPAAGFKRGQRFKWRIELSQIFKVKREKYKYCYNLFHELSLHCQCQGWR